jgi:GT2 family glycosyltransferase
MPTQRIVSIVVPTFNRFERLRVCIDNIRRGVTVPTEVIVVDGGSQDGTRDWLGKQHDLTVILEDRRAGAVAAFNKGFRAATGHYVMWLNDDAFPLPGSVEAALETLERPDLSDVGMVAFYHNWHSERNVLDRVFHEEESYELCHVRGYPYANFGLLRRSLLERIGYADERFYFFGFDPDLSLKIQLQEGLEIVGCRKALVHHDEHHDERKVADLVPGREDNEKLFAKWKQLPPPGQYADPTPGYLKMLSRRGLTECRGAQAELPIPISG